MASLRTQTPEENSRIQQLKVPMRKLRLAHRPFVLTIPDEKGTHFKVSVGRAKNRTVTGLAWKDGSYFRANFDLPPWAKDAAPPKDSNRIYVFKHGGGKSMGTGESEDSGGSYTGVRIRVEGLEDFLAIFEKMIEELVAISRGKRGEVKAANKAEDEAEQSGETPEAEELEAAMKQENAFPIVGVPLNENVVYDDAYTEEIDYNGSGPGEYLAVRTSGGKQKAVVELFGPIPTHDRRGHELKIESLHLREGWQPIVKVEAKNRHEALSQAAQYFSNSGFEAERTYGTLHIHSPGVLSESDGEGLGKTEALVEAKSGKGITLFGKDLDHLDHGFYLLSSADAKKACDGKLPGPGKEKLCTVDGQSYFVAKTPHQGKSVWSIRKTKWTPATGGMKLGESRYYSAVLVEAKKGFQKGQTPFLKARSTGDYGEGEHFVIDLHDEHGRAVPLGGAFKKKDRQGTYYEDDSTGAKHKNMKDFKAYYLKRAKDGEYGGTVKTSAGLVKEGVEGTGVIEEATEAPRKISAIAKEVQKYWPNPHYSAKPYLDAMMEIDTIDDMVLNETGKDIVTRFIGNASTWRGPDAKRIKAELKEMVGWNKK